MEAADSLERFARAGLDRIGLGLDAPELAVIRAADAIYGAQFDALMRLELAEVEPEPCPDLSRAPERE
jgi:hypothetical protein